MKRTYLTILLSLVLAFVIAFPAFADGEGGTTLEQVIQQNVQQVTKQGDTIESGKDIIKDLGKSTDLRERLPEVEKAGEGIKRIVSIIVQIIAYVITFGLVLRVTLDLMYIGLPFMRGFLANGYTGNPRAATGGSTTPGGYGGMSPGMGFGGGFGFQKPFGFGGYGGYGMGMHSTMASSNNTANKQPNRIQLVSNAALNAVAAESTVGPDGKTVSPIKVYMKDMVLVLVFTPIMLVLAISGVLTQLGFALGELISNALRGFGGSLGV